MEPIKPGIQQSLPAKMNVREGDKVRMDCVIVAQPEPEVSLTNLPLKPHCVLIFRACPHFQLV